MKVAGNKRVVIGFLVTFMHTWTYAQTKYPPAVETIQNELIKNFEDTGYGDIEIDLLHKKIGMLLPKLTESMEVDGEGQKRLKLEVSRGASVGKTGEHYLLTGFAYLYPGNDFSIKKVVMVYIRETTGSRQFKIEKRELVNPTPLYLGENQMDSNNDIMINYYESFAGPKDLDKNKIRERIFSSIDRHDRKIQVLDAYKQYLRKTLNALEKKVTGIELDKVTELLYMLELE